MPVQITIRYKMLLFILIVVSARLALTPAMIVGGVNETGGMPSQRIEGVQTDIYFPDYGHGFPHPLRPATRNKHFHRRATSVPRGNDSQPRLSADCQLRPVSLLHISRAGTMINSRTRSKVYHFHVDASLSLLVTRFSGPDFQRIFLIDPNGDPALARHTEGVTQTSFESRNNSSKSSPPNIKENGKKTHLPARIIIPSPPFVTEAISPRTRAASGILPVDLYDRPIGKKGRHHNSMIPQNIGVDMNQNRTIHDPAIGQWSIFASLLFDSIKITGQSCIDFTYQFIDVKTHTPLMHLPASNTTALISLRVEGYNCVSGLVSLELRNESNDVLSSIKLEGYIDDQSQGKALVYFKMPFQPFYFTLIGLDTLKNTFQRQSPRLVSPSQFSVKLLARPPGDLMPRKDYKFVFEINNVGTTAESFGVKAFFDRDKYFTADVDESSVTVEPGNITQVTIVVHVKQYINHLLGSTLIVAVTRASDHFVKRVTTNIHGVPEDFRQDQDPPTCILHRGRGSCDDRKPCLTQRWAQLIDVVDSETGVKSALFLNPNHLRFFNNIFFSYGTRRNRTSRAFLKSVCCNKQFTLRVSDMANNVRNCNITAPQSRMSSDHTPYFTNPSHPSLGMETIFSGISQNTTPRVIRPLNVTQTGFNSAPTVPRYTHRTSSIPFKESSSQNSVTQTGSIFNGTFATNSQRSSWTDGKFTTLRIVAIALGCVGVIAAVVMLSICIAYLCLRRRFKKRISKRGRQGTNESDFTMGASWEPTTPRKRPGRVPKAISLSVISGTNFRRTSTELRGDTRRTWRPTVSMDSGYVSSEIYLQETGDCETDRCYDNKKSSSHHRHTFDDSATEKPSPASLPPDTASNTYSRMLDVQAKLEEMKQVVHNNWTRNLNECDIFHEMGTGDGENESQSSKHSINESLRKDDVHQRHPSRDRKEKLQISEDFSSLQQNRGAEIAHTLHDSLDGSIGSESIQSRSNTSIHLSPDGSPGVRGRAYSLVLLEEKQSGSPELKVYRKAALFHNVAVIKTNDGLGLVKSFPARLRTNNDGSSAFSTEPSRLGEIPDNGPRVRFLSRSAGEMEQVAPKHPSGESDD